MDDLLDSGWGFAGAFVGFIVGVVAVVLLILAFVAVPISKHYAEATCHSFGDRTGREVRFVKYTYWQWDCITPSSDGKWLSTDRLWEETPNR